MWYLGRFIESLLGQRKPEKKDEEKPAVEESTDRSWRSTKRIHGEAI